MKLEHPVIAQLVERRTVVEMAAILSSSELINTAQLAYLAISVDFLFSMFHWTKQRQSCTQWNVLNESREKSPIDRLSCLTISTSAQPVSQSLALLVCLLGRPAMTILWAGVLLKERLLLTHWARISARLPQLDQTSLKITMAAHFWIIGWVTFYQQGNSHSIATLDFYAGLVGMTEFNYYICGSLVAVYTFAGPLFWHIQFHSRANSIFPRRQNERDRLMLAHFSYGMLIWPVSIYSFVCIILRHHLFVWSVFAPKLVYLAFITAFMTPVYAISFLVQLF
ncbi:hypothetical protein Ciccas_010726 [Cichlidogyrus casuarinus]|uniref:GPI ethanolamine phosphate transferase 2 C-terminal domain-containing protein n=1 Tax=Cichlidogyrus casuarinus TaxID=1844966 RepID=A0ABD2PTF4_9PLAT